MRVSILGVGPNSAAVYGRRGSRVAIWSTGLLQWLSLSLLWSMSLLKSPAIKLGEAREGNPRSQS